MKPALRWRPMGARLDTLAKSPRPYTWPCEPPKLGPRSQRRQRWLQLQGIERHRCV